MGKFGIALLALFALLILPFSVSAFGDATPTVAFLGQTVATTTGSANQTNSTILFGISTNVNMTNATFTLIPSPNGNNTIFYNAVIGNNLTSPLYKISNIPDGIYNLSVTARFSNYSLGLQDSWNLSAMSATATKTFTIKSKAGSNVPIITEVAIQESKKSNNTLLIVMGALIILLIYKKYKG